jgi:murein DD-endopeptidase MepM/ murein hydrolase activator NlpD
MRFLAALLLAALPAAAQSVVLMPETVSAGSPVLLQIQAPRAVSIDADWLGRKVQFFRGANGAWFALAGADVETPPGPSTLAIHLHPASGPAQDSTQPVEIHAAQYRTTTLTVAPQFIAPGPADLRRIEADQKLKEKAFASSAPRPLWRGSFRAPVRAEPTDSFGTRRVFNGALDSIHKGMDFRARPGTSVRATNSGIVVLARRLFYEGNCVILDHGLGLYTTSMHLSRIRVREGERVAAGALLGLSGATGRVTGPHLHWAVRWQGASLDPAQLLGLNLESALPAPLP